MKKIGFLVNPIAGMGGKVGLKGTDGADTVARARALGAVPESPDKALRALEVISEMKDRFTLYTLPGDMGEEEAKRAGIEAEVLDIPLTGTAEDTTAGVKALVDAGIEALLFAGGDGTARNVAEVLGESIPVIGIPAGVKIHSAVYATSPTNAGKVVQHFIEGEPTMQAAEVMDIDEEAFRDGRLSARLYGMMNVLVEPRLMQSSKDASAGTDEDALHGMALYVSEEMDDETVYIIGSGSTTREVLRALSLEGTLLGQDVVQAGELLVKDATEQQILEAIEGKDTKIIISPIGGQGYLFGRGNQQISPAVIRKVGKKNIIVISTPQKLQGLGDKPLLADTGDAELDETLKGYFKVIVAYAEMQMKRCGYTDEDEE